MDKTLKMRLLITLTNIVFLGIYAISNIYFVDTTQKNFNIVFVISVIAGLLMIIGMNIISNKNINLFTKNPKKLENTAEYTN
ncbi:MAG: hypothetical protein ACOCV8_04840, partial [Spirochaetota bacterium]